MKLRGDKRILLVAGGVAFTMLLVGIFFIFRNSGDSVTTSLDDSTITGSSIVDNSLTPEVGESSQVVGSASTLPSLVASELETVTAQPNLDSPFIDPVPGVNVGCPGCSYEIALWQDQKLPDLSEAIDGFAPLQANRGQQFGVTVDQAFISEFSDQDWLYQEEGNWVLDGVKAIDLCVNLALDNLTLRNSYVDCPTRTQNDTWGYPGSVNDAPAVWAGGANITIENSTITCSGYDGEICSRSIWANTGVVIRNNDLSFSRGGVNPTSDALVENNFIHHYSFGADVRQNVQDNNPGVTHSNGINLQGQPGVRVRGNYIDAHYGRTTASGTLDRSGTIEIGEPLNGFGIAFYGVEGNGSDTIVENNYIVGAGWTVGCNPQGEPTSCGVFKNNYVELNGWSRDVKPFHMINHPNSAASEIVMECNFFISNGTIGDVITAAHADSARINNNNC